MSYRGDFLLDLVRHCEVSSSHCLFLHFPEFIRICSVDFRDFGVPLGLELGSLWRKFCVAQ